MKLRTVLSLFLSGISLPVIAQYQDKIPKVNPVPPNAAAMFKVLERPLGTYTGTVPISFPLFALTSGPLSADISLNYNSTGGIKVEELASSVGLGFSLGDGAGRITQIIRDKPDDQSGLLNNSNPIRPSNWSCTNMSHVDQNAWGQLDLEPDMYMYSFNGRSGKFFFKENGTIVLTENAGIKIEYIFATPPALPGIKQWIITDENGHKYYFGYNKAGTVNYRIENTSSFSGSSGSSPGAVTSVSWFLTEAYDMNEENNLKYTYVLSGNAFTCFSGGFMPLNLGGLDCGGFNTTSDQGMVTTISGEYLISRIDASSGYLLFNSNTDRLDGGRKLNTIQLYDSAGVFKKRYQFNYDYFTSSSPVVRRLKLVNFSAFGTSLTDSLTHRFEYEEVVNLPSQMSRAVDFWGYYNGVSNTTSFPNFVYQSGGTYRMNNLANRNVNSTYAAANILKKIIYPTGGSREFFYEGNTALYNVNLNQYHPDPDYTTNQSFTRTDFNTGVSPASCMLHNFSVSSVDGGAQFKYVLSGIGGSCSGYYVKLFMVPNAGDQTGGVQLFSMLNASTFTYNVVNGHYRLEVYKPSSSCTLTSITGSWGECTFSTATIVTPNGTYYRNNRKAGGVRVKEIRDYDPLSNMTASTLYRYKLYATDSSFTSGLLVSILNMFGQENITGTGCSYIRLMPQSNYPLAAQDGSYVVYPEVRTIENGKGWTDYKYSYAVDVPSVTGFPKVPSSDNSILRGQLLSQKVYDQSGVLINRKMATYQYGTIQSQLGVIAKAYWLTDLFTPQWTEVRPEPPVDDTPDMAACNTYGTNGQARFLWQTIDSTFSVAGNTAIVKDYKYAVYNAYYALQKEITTVNNIRATITTYKYPFTTNADFTFGLSMAEQVMKTTLLGKNYLQPIEIVDSLKPASGTGSLRGGAKFSFSTFNTSDIHLSQVLTYTTINDSTETNLSGYDVKGNLLEQYQTNGVKEVYLWGYSKQYPVAKVVGSNYAAVSGLVNHSILNTPASDAALRTELNNIRTGLTGTGVMVTTYTYNPLMGITSITDPSGKTIYYEYDGLGRLIHLRDQGNNILKKNEYKIAGVQ